MSITIEQYQQSSSSLSSSLLQSIDDEKRRIMMMMEEFKQYKAINDSNVKKMIGISALQLEMSRGLRKALNESIKK